MPTQNKFNKCGFISPTTFGVAGLRFQFDFKLIGDYHRREIDIRVLAKARAFKRPMRFPFQRIKVTACDHFRGFLFIWA
jgi:hypothetical protein